ncbi:unnamed protein product [Symbiodinium natans]|uniref:Uncharacterized protein n=1 Tax=Symbiodinium natans TaxID=878477 RepID=A0A812ID90_9DINO|nr:unnamed protein product [Symbiodinium natans]
MDFLSLLESDTEVAVSDETALQQQESDKLVAVQNFPRTTSQGDFQRRAVFPSLKGRVGKGRHGLYAERALLACHMRSIKFARRVENFSESVAELLRDSHFIHESRVLQLRIDRSSKAVGIALQVMRPSQRGNRYKRKLAWHSFLEASYGRICRNSALAQHLDVARSTVKHMQVMTSSAFMNNQALFVAKLVSWCSEKPPSLCLKHFKWDETQLLCTMNADKSSQRVRSSWQVLVLRVRLVLAWEDGSSVVIRLVLPPVSLLATGAEHQYYSLFHHPAYKCINGLVGLLRQHAHENMDLAETDGASSNMRLLAHLVQQAKSNVAGRGGHPLLFTHCRCMNHAVQLNNASLLAIISPTLLNRIYGMTVFVRNLGYWMRIRQAVQVWVDRTLRFRTDVMASNPSEHVQPHAAICELIDYLRMWKKLDRHSSKVENYVPEPADDDSESAFDRKARAFLDMWNGDDVSGEPCHICSSESLPLAQRHCADRATAVRKCSDALLDLFLAALPSVPTPSKWTKLFSPLDFCLAGAVVHNWLEHVFQDAFGEMVFKEYDEDVDNVDPRLVETLSFHVVNGRRLQTSMSFLQNRHEKWALSLLTVAIEPNRVLTWYWLKCLGQSLSPGKRPPLYCLLDPRSSVLTSMLQHYSLLLSSETGAGRMRLLWSTWGYDTFARFCLCEPHLVREIRRVLLHASAWQYRRHFEYLHGDAFLVAVVGDEQACPEVLSSFLASWRRKRACCVTPGLARALKAREVTAEDLLSKHWKRIMHFYASTLQLSVADVEVKHAANRQNAESGFSTIAAKFINSDSYLIARQARQHTWPASAKEKVADIQVPAGDLTVKDKTRRRAKGKSALELYRAEWLRQQQFGGAVNPVTRAVWDQVRDAWRELPAEQKQIYEAMAQATKQDAKLQRAQHQVIAQPAISDSQDVRALHGQPFAPKLLNAMPLQRLLETRDLKALVSPYSGGEPARSKFQLAKHDYPVSEEIWKA